MTQEEFIEITGEDPEDILGPDWFDLIDDYVNSDEPNEYFHDGHEIGGCYWCKMD